MGRGLIQSTSFRPLPTTHQINKIIKNVTFRSEIMPREQSIYD